VGPLYKHKLRAIGSLAKYYYPNIFPDMYISLICKACGPTGPIRFKALITLAKVEDQ
jgi:hypothetical protein